jgi:aldehyde:ferredoxin oxidoreductase
MYVRRKVFSNVEQPVEEQLYSVTMTEEEYNLFSEFMEERQFTDWQEQFKKLGKKGESFDQFMERMKKAAAESVENTKNNNILGEGERTISETVKNNKIAAGMKGRAYGKAALKHLKANKVAYGVGAAGVGAAGLAYAAGSHKK